MHKIIYSDPNKQLRGKPNFFSNQISPFKSYSFPSNGEQTRSTRRSVPTNGRRVVPNKAGKRNSPGPFVSFRIFREDSLGNMRFPLGPSSLSLFLRMHFLAPGV